MEIRPKPKKKWISDRKRMQDSYLLRVTFSLLTSSWILFALIVLSILFKFYIVLFEESLVQMQIEISELYISKFMEIFILILFLLEMAKRGSQTTRKMFVSQITTRGVGSFLQDKSLSNFGDYENAHVFQTPSRMTRQDEAKEPAGNSQKVQNFMKNQTNENLINFKKMLKQKISNSVHKGNLSFHNCY